MRILRVSLTYPRENMPGVGLPCYYHSNNSNEDNMILTLKLDGKKIESKDNVRIEEVKVKNPELGNVNKNIFIKTFFLIRKIFYQLLFLFKSIKIIKKFKPDIVHVYSPIPIMIGIFCKAAYKSKLVLSLHGTDVERIYRSKMMQKILLIPDRVVCVSESMISRLKEVKLKRDMVYIGNGFENNVFYNKSYQRKKQFISVANLRWQKGHKYMIRAFAEFVKDNREYKLLLIGDGPDREKLIELTKSLGLEGKVIFRGIQSRDVISEELNKSKAFILSSIIEGFPKVIIESMGCGTPVIGTDVGNVSNVIGDSGIIIEKEDIDSLLNAMLEISKSLNWEELSNKSMKLSEKYTWNIVNNNLESVYNNIN